MKFTVMQADYPLITFYWIHFDVTHAAVIIKHIFLAVVAVWHSFSTCRCIWLVHLQHWLKQSAVYRYTFTCNNTASHFINTCFVIHFTGINTFTHPWFAYYSTYCINNTIASFGKGSFFLSHYKRSSEHSLFLHQQSASHTHCNYFIWYNH